MSTTLSQCIPNSHGRHDPSSPPSATSAPYPNAIFLTDLPSISEESIHSSASAAQVTASTSSPTAHPTPENAQAAAGQTWYRKTWIHVRKTLGSWCTACGPPQLLVGLVGLGLAIPLLKLSIYSYQLSQWTAWKDFRQDCKSLNVSAPHEVHLDDVKSYSCPSNIFLKSARLRSLGPSLFPHMYPSSHLWSEDWQEIYTLGHIQILSRRIYLRRLYLLAQQSL